MRIALLILLSLPMASHGAEPAAAEDRIAPSQDEPTSMGAPVSQDTLDEQRGGDDDIVNNVIRVTGEVTDNTADNVVTGANNIQDGSFVSSSGITSVVQNTGANVLIQTATIVNVQFAPP